MMKTGLIWAIAGVILFLGSAQAKYGGGSGTAGDPYKIRDANQMNTIGLHEEDWSSYFELANDINLAGYTGMSFNIIGTSDTNAFTGIFDGNEYTIFNFTYDMNGPLYNQYVGLFGCISGGQVRHLGLVNPDVNGGYGEYTGGLAGGARGGMLFDCHVNGGSISGESVIGGLVGDIREGTVLEDCYANSAVDGNNCIGGLVGYSWEAMISECRSMGDIVGRGSTAGGLVGSAGDTVITDCSSSSDISGWYSTGGLVGECMCESVVTSCYATGDIQTKWAWYYGGLIGWNNGVVQDCYATGDLTGWGSWGVGGLVGCNWTDPCIVEDVRIENCYSTGDVYAIGGAEVGGFLGRAEGGSVTNCYSIGSADSSSPVGGFLGRMVSGTIAGCFWDTETSGNTTSAAGGEGKTTEQMQSLSTYTDAGWDFNTPVWKQAYPNDYPRLAWQQAPYHPYGGGCGTADEPFLIYTAEEINAIGDNPGDRNKHFRLMADIDLGTFTGTQFNIIGSSSSTAPFTGIFDGRGHTVSNFTYESIGVANIGLFGCVDDANAQIMDLILLEPDVNAGTGNFVGSVVGYLKAGSVSGCSARMGSIVGGERVGGLVGATMDATVSRCSSSSSVSGGQYVGGLVGIHYGGSSVDNSWCAGSLIGDNYVGGMVGLNIGELNHCYSAGAVEGTSNVGGFAGWSNGTITDCFWDVNTSGTAISDGGTGETTDQMQTKSTFTDAGWDFAGESANGLGELWGICDSVEYPQLAWEYGAGDFDDDGSIDFVDYAILGQRWGQNEGDFWCGGGMDFSGDGVIGVDDILVLCSRWLEGI